jgi:sugar porter (SP) family MFS transporter
MNRQLVIRCAVVASLGGFLFGFDTAVISGTTGALTELWQLTPGQLGVTVSSALWGTIVGALIGGIPADRFGRRPVLFVIAALYVISALGTALVSDWGLFLALRILGGLAVGGASVIAPLYTAEISPTRIRGRLVATVQFNIVIGIVAAYVSNWIIVGIAPSDLAWRWMLGIEAVPAALFFVLLFTIPESPRWLAGKGRTAEADPIMKALFDPQEYEAVRASLASPGTAGALQSRHRTRFFSRANLRPILLATLIAVFSQFAGTNAILYYAPSLLEQAGIPGDSAFFASISVGVVNMVFTAVGMILIDRIGRRPLVTIGASINLAALLAIAVIFLVTGSDVSPVTGMVILALILVFIAALAAGLGSVLWPYIAEIFPNEHRARGQALGSTAHWVSSALVSGLFPVMAAFSMTFTFLFYAAFMAAAVIWSRTMMVETKGTRLEEVH